MFDFPLQQLHTYRPDVAEPADFDTFWSRTLVETNALRVNADLQQVDVGMPAFDIYDVTYAGFRGDPIRAWLIAPKESNGTCVVSFVGYGGGRNLPHEHLAWAATGRMHLVMDTRGQGSAWGSGGDTADPHGSDAQSPGFMTRGVGAADTYYYRRVFTDAAMLIELARSLPGVERVVAAGGSQGGGIAIAAATLAHADACMPEVPFLCHFERAIAVTDAFPYSEIVQYLAVHDDKEQQVMQTLSYFDGVNFAKRAGCPALFSVALRDEICPPSTVFAARNAWQGDAEITVYPMNGHEGGRGRHFLAQRDWLTSLHM
jgi:cephalosporin-C deacetylase